MTDLRAIFERVLDRYHAHDAAGLASLYAEDAVIRVAGEEVRGRDGVAMLWAMWFAAFPDVRSDIDRITVEADRFAAEWTEYGTQRGPVRIGDLVVPARGRQLRWRGVSVYVVRDGAVASVDYYVDRLLLSEQLLAPVSAVLRVWGAAGRSGRLLRSRR